MHEILKIYSYAGGHRGAMLKAILCLTVGVILGVVPYFLINQIILRFTGGKVPTMPYLCAMAAAIFICLFLKTYFQHKGLSISHRLAYDTLMGMRKKVADKLLKIPMGALSRHSTGGLKKNFIENIENMEILLAHAAPEGISNLLTFVFISVALFIADWRMALLSLIVLPIGMVPVFLMVKDGMTKMEPYYRSSKEMNENIIEYISGMEVIKVFGQTASSFKKYRASVDGYKKYTLDWFKVSWNYMAIYSIVLPSTLLFLIPFGTLFYTGGTLGLSTFVLCILLAMSMGGPLLRIVDFIPTIPQLGLQAGKITEIFNEPELISGNIQTAPAKHDVSFEHVSFAYDEKEVIQDVSFTAQENSVTALIGESGAGKSTLAKLLVRFWDVKNGMIKIGGVDIRQFSFGTLMDQISYVSQDIFLFNVSIMENIRMGRPAASDDEVVSIAKAAQCHEFIMETDRGYHTIVGGSGDKLSGGQRQRISIARAMLKNAPVVVLDEATSFTDPENEDRIQAALNELIQGKTIIVIAHRLSTIVDADNIILMEDGRIHTQGTHADLLDTSATYQKMWQAHTESMEWDIVAANERGNG